jgi:hypothetical protein
MIGVIPGVRRSYAAADRVLGLEAMVLLLGCWTIVLAEVVISPVDPGDGEVLGFVVAVFWREITASRHRCGSVLSEGIR